MHQLVLFLSVSHLLESSQPDSPRIQLYAQDPAFTRLDRVFLGSHGIQILEVDEQAPWSGAPATQFIDSQTFLFCPFIVNELLARISGASDPRIAITTSISHAISTIDERVPTMGYTQKRLGSSVSPEEAENYTGSCDTYPEVSFREEALEIIQGAKRYGEKRIELEIPSLDFEQATDPEGSLPFDGLKLYLRKDMETESDECV
jgi:hypothetical protein